MMSIEEIKVMLKGHSTEQGPLIEWMALLWIIERLEDVHTTSKIGRKHIEMADWEELNED